MPYASKALIKSTQATLASGSFAARMKMLRTTPIAPPDGSTGMRVWEKATAADGSKFMKGTSAARATDFSKIKIRSLADMIGFLKVDAGTAAFTGGMTLIVKLASELKTEQSRKGWVPCWFLPWMSARIFKLKIISSLTNPVLDFGDPSIENTKNPDLFFTAGINGCSVFSIGDATSPNVYHGGINPGGHTMPLNANETTEAAWRRMLERKTTSTKFVGEVGKTDYISELNPGFANDADRTRLQTAQSILLEQRLQGQGKLSNVMVIPWGAVFGLRDTAGAWHMNLVKNATVTYRRVVVTERNLFKPNVTATKGESMPNTSLSRNAAGLVDLKATAKDPNSRYGEQNVQTCVNLGHQEFFPGAGVATYKSLGSVSVH